MKRLSLLVAAGLAACTTQTTPLPADLVSPQALAVSGAQVFVASTDNDELRILDLNLDGGARSFEPAPNPIYVLSVPVATRPVALAADTDGQGHTGKYIFSLSTVAARLSVVVAADEREEAEVVLPGTPLSIVARTAADGGARVYVGLALGDGQGAVATVDVPAPADLPSAALTAEIAFTLGPAAPAGLDLSPDGTTLALGDSAADESAPDPAQRRGGLILLNLASGDATRVNVGGPAGRVLFNPQADEVDDPADTCDTSGAIVPGTVAAGDYVYVLVEGSGCPLGQLCGGVQVVHQGQVLEVSPGVPQPPVRIPGAATDLAVAASGGGLNLDLGGIVCKRPRLLLAAPSTNGFIYFLDGESGQFFNVNGDDATGNVGAVELVVDGGAAPSFDADAGPQHIFAEVGGLPEQTIIITYEGTLPVLIDRPAEVIGGDGGALLVDVAADFRALGAEPGDLVLLSGGGAGCPGTAVIAATQSGALQLGTPVDPSCFPAGGSGTYSVQVGTSSEPYLVQGSVSGYLGRIAPNQDFSSNLPPEWRSPSYTPGHPVLSFTMGSGITDPGSAFEFDIGDGLFPDNTGGGPNAIQPGPIVWSSLVQKFFVGYPGSQLGSQISEIDPGAVVPDTSSGVIEYE